MFIQTGHRWLTPVTLATWDTEIRRMDVQDQPGQIVPKIPPSKIKQSKMDWRCGSSGRYSACFAIVNP
jgi:hypothetical protein